MGGAPCSAAIGAWAGCAPVGGSREVDAAAGVARRSGARRGLHHERSRRAAHRAARWAGHHAPHRQGAWGMDRDTFHAERERDRGSVRGFPQVQRPRHGPHPSGWQPRGEALQSLRHERSVAYRVARPTRDEGWRTPASGRNRRGEPGDQEVLCGPGRRKHSARWSAHRRAVARLRRVPVGPR